MANKGKPVYPNAETLFQRKARCSALVRAETKEAFDSAVHACEEEGTLGGVLDAMVAPLMVRAAYADRLIAALDDMLDALYTDWRADGKTESLRVQYIALWEMRDVMARKFGKSIRRDPQIALR